MKDLISVLNKNKEIIENAIKLDIKEWEYKNSFEEIIKIVNEKSEEKIEKNKNSKLISYEKNIAVIGKITPKVLITLVTYFSKINVKVNFFVKEKLLATNQVIIESISKEFSNFSLTVINKNDDFYKVQNDFDTCIYIGNKKEYLDFSRRLNINSIYKNYGEIYVFLENKEFKNNCLDLEKFAYDNDIETKYYIGNLEKAILDVDSKGPVDAVLIFTKNVDSAYKIANEIYAENVYVNIDLTKKYKFDFDIEKLFYKKKIVLK